MTDDTPVFDAVERDIEARKAFFSDPEVAARQAQVDELCARAQDPDDVYDGHHGTDRSGDSLAWLRDNDPVNYERILGKIAAEGGVPDEH